MVVTDIDVLAISGGIYEDLPPTDPSEGSFVQNQRLAYKLLVDLKRSRESLASYLVKNE